MSVWLYAAYTLLYILIMGWGARLWLQTRRFGILILLAVTFGVFYDNLILALGNVFKAGELLYALSVPRFALHQLILPWVIVVGALQARDAGIAWAQSQRALQLAIASSGALMAFGVLTRVLPLQLAPEMMDGVTRYVATNSHGPPLVSILALTFVGVSGFFLWRKCGWVWVFAMSLLVFVGEAIPDESLRRSLGSGVEVMWLVAMLATERWLARRDRELAKAQVV